MTEIIKMPHPKSNGLNMFAFCGIPFRFISGTLAVPQATDHPWHFIR